MKHHVPEMKVKVTKCAPFSHWLKSVTLYEQCGTQALPFCLSVHLYMVDFDVGIYQKFTGR